MTNSKTTKRALFSSVVALLLCFTMLLGTTFAWFTDSATSGRNIIQSGNLDVVLEYKTSVDGEWTPVTENTKLFKEGALYEPGYTEVVFLRVSNAGSLALKYNLNVNVYGETTSTNVDGEPFSLKDSLEIGYYAMDESMGQYLLGTMFGTREAALSNVTTTKLSAYDGVVCKDQPLPKGDAFSPLLVALVLTMPTTVGNEANHMTGVVAPTIDLGVTLLATQYTDETDSFDNQYDKDATYPELADVWDGTVDTEWYDDAQTELIINTAEELAAFAAQVNGGNTFVGKTVTLGRDVDLNNKEWTPIGGYDASNVFSGTFDGDGHIISNLTIAKTDASNVGLFSRIKNATVKNIKVVNANINAGNAGASVLVMIADGTNTISDITISDGSVTAKTFAAGVFGTTLSGSTSLVTMSNISVYDLSLNVSGTDTYASAIAANLYNADGTSSTVNGFNVQDVSISATGTETYVGGVFGECQKGSVTVTDGTVKNLTVVSNASSASYVGGVIGDATKVDPLSVADVTVTNLDVDFTGKDSKAGGIIAWDDSVSNYINVTVQGTIDGTGASSQVGGFVGCANDYEKTFTDCSANVAISSQQTVGGFVGFFSINRRNNLTTTFTNCTASGDMSTTGETGIAGGFVGQAVCTNGNTLALNGVKAEGAVTASGARASAGGLIGMAMGNWSSNVVGYVVITDSTASTNVTGATNQGAIGNLDSSVNAKIS